PPPPPPRRARISSPDACPQLPPPPQPWPPPPQPPHPPRASCMALPTFSLSKRWNVARLTSCISSSPRTKRCLGEVSSDCGIQAAGIVDADALLDSERPSPAAPSTFTVAALVVRFCFEACLTRGMVASSVSERLLSIPAQETPTLR